MFYRTSGQYCFIPFAYICEANPNTLVTKAGICVAFVCLVTLNYLSRDVHVTLKFRYVAGVMLPRIVGEL